MSATLAVGANGCAAPPAAPPPVVEYAGCASVLEPGTLCTLRAERELRLWVESPWEGGVELRVDGRRVEATGMPVGEGQRFTLAIAPGARGVEVRVSERGDEAPGAEWSLRFAEAGEGPATTRRAPRRDVQGEVDEETRRVYRLLRARDLAAARATLGELTLPPKAPAESRYLMSYYRGLLAEREGDYRTALAEVRRAVEIAERVGPERYRWLAEEELALLLRGVGRSREAAELFERLRRTPHAAGACEEAQLLNNLAWSTLLAREAGERLGDPTALLEEALDKYDGCESAAAERKGNALINLALAHLQEGRPARARELLGGARRLEPHPSVPHALWWLDLEGRIDLAEGRARGALARFGELEALAAETGAADGRLRAALGRARAHEALGDADAALEVLRQGAALLDEGSLQVPLDQGRETFLAARRSVVSLHLDILLDQGRTGEAFAVARQARSRVLRQLAQVDSLASLPAAAQTRRARLLTEYQQRRAALEQRASDDWKLPADRLRHERAARRRESTAVKALLDQAYRLGGVAGPQGGGGPPPPRRGELVLAYHPLDGDEWVAFAAGEEGVAVHRFELPPAPLSSEELSRRLLLPFQAPIGRAERLRILASGPVDGVDLQALPFGGEPLVGRLPVAYGLDLPVPREPRRAAPRAALLVTDPRGDLPGARREARTLREVLGASPRRWTVEELRGDAASVEAVRDRLGAAALLHYAGHGDYSGSAGWDSSLLLAGETRLTLGDLLALDGAPAWVVLSACDSGRASAEIPVATLGLAHAFLLAGSRAVVASTRPADDAKVPAFFTELYRQWEGEPDLAVAMQRAQLAWRQRDPTADWSAFRLYER